MDYDTNTNITILWTATSGINNIYLRIDGNRSINELNEDNNLANNTIDVFPDLIVIPNSISFSTDNPDEGDTIDIIAEAIPGAYKAVVTLESEYLNDPTMADLVDGKFSVVGKVIRTVEAEKGTISLLRQSRAA